jgi:hypothetical protein
MSQRTESTDRPSPHVVRAATIPQLVICAGIPGSGSTWAYNAVRGLLGRHHPELPLSGFFTERIEEEHDPAMRHGGACVIKTHAPDHAMRTLMRLARLPVILTIRDPRDGAASLMRRFGMPFPEAFRTVVNAATAALRIVADCPTLVLRYESGLTAGTHSLAAIANFMGVPTGGAMLQEIAEELSPGAVSALIDRLQADGVFDGTAPVAQFDAATLWHPRHVGEGRVGSYREILSPGQVASLTYATRDFMDAFGYERLRPAIPPGSVLGFDVEGTGTAYLAAGFSHVESWGVWTQGELARLELPLQQPVTNALWITMDCRLGACHLANDGEARVAISVNDLPVLELEPGSRAEALTLSCYVQAAGLVGLPTVGVVFHCRGLRSPAQLGLGSDTRKLGIGLVRMAVEYS